MTNVTYTDYPCFRSLQDAMSKADTKGILAVYQVVLHNGTTTLEPDLMGLPDFDTARRVIESFLYKEWVQTRNPLVPVGTFSYLYGLLDYSGRDTPCLTKQWTETPRTRVNHIPVIAPQIPDADYRHTTFHSRWRECPMFPEGTYAIIAYDPCELCWLTGCSYDRLPVVPGYTDNRYGRILNHDQ